MRPTIANHPSLLTEPGSLFGRSATAAASTLFRRSAVRPRGSFPEGGGLASRPMGSGLRTGRAQSAGRGWPTAAAAPTSWAPAAAHRPASLPNWPSHGIRCGRRTDGICCFLAGRSHQTPLPLPNPIGTGGLHRSRADQRAAPAPWKYFVPRASARQFQPRGIAIGASCLPPPWAMRATSGSCISRSTIGR